MAPRPPLLPVLAALLALGSCGGADPTADESGWSAVLVTLDTTRADALGCYGAPAGRTPEIDRLAAEGVRYDDAWSPVPLTLPAHASALTGLFPPRHGLHENGAAALSREALTVAERAREAGLETAAFVSAAVLGREYGLDQGFERYDQVERVGVARELIYEERPGSETARAACEWLAGRDRGRRFFLWVHLFDPHAPYRPAPEFLARAGGDAYAGEVAAADAALGAIAAALRREPGMDRVVIAVAADHGEGLGEHGEATHGAFCYRSTLRVPLVLRWPDGRGAGTAEDRAVSLVDVAPTLVEALGLAPLPGIDGQSLFGRRPPERRDLWIESWYGWINFGWSALAGWTDGRAVYRHSSEPEFHDLSADPGEQRDLFGERAADEEAARAAMRALLERPRLAPAEIGGALPASERLSDLARLGYAGAGGAAGELPDPLDPAATAARPSPRSRVAELARFQEAQDLAQGGKAAEAIPRLEAIVSGNPLHLEAWFQLGVARMEAGRFAEAIEPFQHCLALGREWDGPHRNLALSLERAGRIDEAVAHYLRAWELEPELAIVLPHAAELLERLGRSAEAAEVRARIR